MKRFKFCFLMAFSVIVLSSFTNATAQNLTLEGKVSDAVSGESLSFANVRVEGKTTGTSANIEGSYKLLLPAGNYEIVISFIGYVSDTLKIDLRNNTIVDTELKPVALRLPEVTVLPGENPALEIIRRAIKYKQDRGEKLNNYVFKAYTKGLVKTTQKFSSDDNSVTIGIGTADTADLMIAGIIENESRGYFKKPDNYKDEIVAQKQSANTPSSINVLTGGRLIQDFYRDDLQFFGRNMPSPISTDALEYYYFILEDTLRLDNKTVFQVFFEPDDTTDPGFRGKLFIADSLFNLLKVDVSLNSAANIGGIFSFIKIFQQFLPFKKDIYMPVDYRVFVEGNYLGIAKFGFELNSIFYNYDINSGIEDDFFDRAIITVLPEADKKDSLYWAQTLTIPNTLDEVEAYQRIDSTETARKQKTFWDRFSFFAFDINYGNNISSSGPLSLYYFNKIEGHGINFEANAGGLFNRRFWAGVKLAYGFNDKKFKQELSARYRFGTYRTGRVSLRLHNGLTSRFKESDNYNALTSTLTSLFGKWDFRDYYYSSGVSASFSTAVTSWLDFGAGFLNRTDKSAKVNTDFSLLKRNQQFAPNEPVYDARINALTAEIKLDARKYIEDGYYRRKITQGEPTVLFSGDVVYSPGESLSSEADFTLFHSHIWFYLPSVGNTVLTAHFRNTYSSGAVPYQMMYALPGNISGGGKTGSFRTLGFGEYFGDRVTSLTAEYDFQDDLFRWLGIPYLKESQIFVSAHFNTALLKISAESSAIIPVVPKTLETPFYEAGFSIGHPLFPLIFEFTWKLNHFGENNFVFGINTFAM